MRDFMSARNNGVVTLTPSNLAGLQKANYLYHSALNSCWIALVYCFLKVKIVVCVFLPQGLACEAINAEKLLWKVRPKVHKFLGDCVGVLTLHI